MKLLLILIITALLLLSISCGYEDLGLKEVEAEELNEPYSLGDITSEDFFYRLKTQQRIQNPLNDINIRKAIFHAIDREKITEEILGEYGNIQNGLFSKNSPFYYPAWEKYEHDLELAKDYLKRAGYGPDNPLYVTIGFSERSHIRKEVADLIRDELGAIGIYLWIEDHTSKDWYSSVIRSGDYELGIWSLYNYDGSELESYFGSGKIPPMETSDNRNCNNYYWYRNEGIDNILEGIKQTDDIEEKVELYTQMQQRLADDAVILPLYSRLYTVAHNSGIENITINTENGSLLSGLKEWKASPIQEDRAIVIGYEEEPLVINPFSENYLFNRYINEVLFEGLWAKNNKGGYDEVLVEDYSRVTNMAAAVTPMVDVKLQDDIYWEDGSEITSEDVYYTWKAFLDTGPLLGENSSYEDIKDIEIINEKEFRVIFNRRKDNWKDLFASLLPAEEYKKSDSGISPFEDLIVSNGPYKLSRWVKGQHLLLERNENYRGEKPDIQYLQFVFNTDINRLISALKAGDIDVLSVPANLTLLEEIEEHPDLELLIKEGNLWEHLAFSLKPKD